MTRTVTQRTRTRRDIEKTDDLWVIGLFAGSGIAAAAFVLFLAFYPQLGQIDAKTGRPEAFSSAVAEAPVPAPLPASQGERP